MMTVPLLARGLTIEAANSLSRSVRSMPDEKLTWKVMCEARSALDMLVECAGSAMFVAEILNSREAPDPHEDMLEKLRQKTDTLTKGLLLLKNGIEALTVAIDDFPVAHLDETVVLPFAGGITKSYATLMLLPYWNMSYHLGQINFIQTLYGDKEMH